MNDDIYLDEENEGGKTIVKEKGNIIDEALVSTQKSGNASNITTSKTDIPIKIIDGKKNLRVRADSTTDSNTLTALTTSHTALKAEDLMDSKTRNDKTFTDKSVSDADSVLHKVISSSVSSSEQKHDEVEIIDNVKESIVNPTALKADDLKDPKKRNDKSFIETSLIDGSNVQKVLSASSSEHKQDEVEIIDNAGNAHINHAAIKTNHINDAKKRGNKTSKDKSFNDRDDVLSNVVSSSALSSKRKQDEFQLIGNTKENVGNYTSKILTLTAGPSYSCDKYNENFTSNIERDKHIKDVHLEKVRWDSDCELDEDQASAKADGEKKVRNSHSEDDGEAETLEVIGDTEEDDNESVMDEEDEYQENIAAAETATKEMTDEALMKRQIGAEAKIGENTSEFSTIEASKKFVNDVGTQTESYLDIIGNTNIRIRKLEVENELLYKRLESLSKRQNSNLECSMIQTPLFVNGDFITQPKEGTKSVNSSIPSSFPNPNVNMAPSEFTGTASKKISQSDSNQLKPGGKLTPNEKPNHEGE